MSAARHKFVRWNKQKEKKTDFLLCFNCCVLLMKPLKKQLIHITNSQHEQHMWLSDADIHETKVTAAASLAKYILYITCHSFWVCNLMLAIKNFCAASHGTQFYSIDALKWSFFFPSSSCSSFPVTDLCLLEEFAIPNHSLLIPTLFSRPITQFISNCWLITKNYGLWERPQNGILMFLWFSIELLLVCFSAGVCITTVCQRKTCGSGVRCEMWGQIWVNCLLIKTF